MNVLELFLLGRQVFRKLTFYLIKEEKVFQSLFKFSVTRDIPPSPSFLPLDCDFLFSASSSIVCVCSLDTRASVCQALRITAAAAAAASLV